MTKQTVLDRMPLGGVRRVEGYPQTLPEPSAQRHQVFLEAQRTAYPGQQLEAPGILANPVPVEALYDPDAARDVALRNLLQRRGYADLEAVQKEGREEGRQERREEGQKTGQLALVLHQLQRAIGQIPESDSQRIRRLDCDGLVALAEALLDFRAESDLTSLAGTPCSVLAKGRPATLD